MALQLLQFNPGIVKDITEYSAGKTGPFWVDGDLVRFRNGYPTKIGGWQKDKINLVDSAGTITSTETTITGIARAMVNWRAITDGEDRIAVGTHNHLYIIQDQSLYDITPLRNKSNNATTTAEALDASETEIDLVSGTDFKTAGTIKIDSELITYTGKNSNQLTGCTRGTNSTSAATHDSGAVVTQVLINPIATNHTQTDPKIVTITDAAHGAKVGDFVVITGAAATGGITAENLNRKAGYQITSVTTNTYTIVSPTDATGTVSGGGNSVGLAYLIGIDAELGTQSSDPALGWGVGGWGIAGWNEPRSEANSDINLSNSNWSLNLWGEDLIANVRGGGIYYWDTSGTVSNRAVLVSSLSGALSVPSVSFVSTVSFPDRHFIAGGAQEYSGGGNVDPMLIRWSDQEDFTDFGPTSTNTAGDQRLQVGTKIVAMTPAREETIISTDEAIYGMTFVGPPFIFSFRLLATNSGAAGLNTMLTIDGDVFWMGKRNFFVYNGVVKELPCSVQYYVFDRMQTRYIDKTSVGHNKQFKEITWFYVSNENTASTNPEPDSYVTFNYLENAWSVGSMDRTVWRDSFGSRDVPFAFDKDGYLYNHETGTSADGAAMTSFIESSPGEIPNTGQDLYLVDKVIPDVTMTSDTNLSLFINTRKYPNATEVTKGPFSITSSTTKVSTRAKGRQMSMKLQSSGTLDDWSLGTFRINAREDGLR
tara:strand:+ start:1333 stop:3453 length:2121 start_codon:yes stop_codon:yes gene_type:complete